MKQKISVVPFILIIMLAIVIATAPAAAEPTYSFDLRTASHVTLEGTTYLITQAETPAILPVKATIPAGETIRAYNASATFSGDTTQINLIDRTGIDWIKTENQPNIVSTSVAQTDISGTVSLFDVYIKDTMSLEIGSTYTIHLHLAAAAQENAALDKTEWEQTITIRILPKPAPPSSSGSSGSGSSVIIDPSVPKIHGIYVADVNENGNANFPSHLVIFQIHMSDGYTGSVTITTYQSPTSAVELDTYHHADIKIDSELADGETAIIRFKIPLAELNARGLNPADACLYIYGEENGWRHIPTVYEVAGDMVYYEAEVSEFGMTAIVFEKDSATPKGEAKPTPTETEAESPLSVLAVLGGLGAAVVLRRR